MACAPLAETKKAPSGPSGPNSVHAPCATFRLVPFPKEVLESRGLARGLRDGDLAEPDSVDVLGRMVGVLLLDSAHGRKRQVSGRRSADSLERR